MCGCDCSISTKSMHYSLLTWRCSHMEQLKDQSHNMQNISYGKISSSIFETYTNSVGPHGFHIHNTAAYMAMATMCTSPSAHHALPHCKCVLCCCGKCPSMVIPSQEGYIDTTKTFPTLCSHIYKNVSCFTLNGRLP